MLTTVTAEGCGKSSWLGSYLSVVPADVTPALHTGLQPNGGARQEVFVLHTQVAANVSDLR